MSRPVKDNELYNKYRLSSRNQKKLLKLIWNKNKAAKKSKKAKVERPRFLNCNFSLPTWQPKLESGLSPRPIVEIRRFSIDEFIGYYASGLFRCGSVWLCPTCASKIVYFRSRRIKYYLSQKHHGNYCMVTETWPHHHDSLESNWNFAVEFRKRRANRSRNLHKFKSWKKILHDFKINEIIMSWDVTWTPANGWHHHSHSIYHAEGNYIPVTKLEEALRKNWEEETKEAIKRHPERYRETLSKVHGDVSKIAETGIWASRPPNPAAYINELGLDKYIREIYSIAEEVVGSNSKKRNSKKGIEPWLLSNSELLYEYAMATKGRKLINPYPRSLAKKIETESDSEILEKSPESEMIGYITHEDWQRYRQKITVQDLIEFYSENPFAKFQPAI